MTVSGSGPLLPLRESKSLPSFVELKFHQRGGTALDQLARLFADAIEGVEAPAPGSLSTASHQLYPGRRLKSGRGSLDAYIAPMVWQPIADLARELAQQLEAGRAGGLAIPVLPWLGAAALPLAVALGAARILRSGGDPGAASDHTTRTPPPPAS